MKKKVYITNSIFLNEGFNDVNLRDKNIDFIGKMCITTIGKLLESAGDIEKNVPVFWGSAYSCLNSLHEFNKVCEKSGALMVNPSLFPNTVLNSPACRAGIHFNITQPIYNISNGSSSGLDALGLAYMYIANGEIDAAIVCAAEEESEIAQKIEGKAFIQSCAAIYLSAQKSDLEILEYRKDYAKIMLLNEEQPIYGSINALYQIDCLLKNYMRESQFDIECIIDSYKTTIRLRCYGGKNDRNIES